MALIQTLRPYFWGMALHGLFLLLASGALLVLGAPQHLDHLWLGGALGALNVVVVLWTVSRLMKKKPIALTVAVSVFKYGFLIAMIWLVTQSHLAVGFSFFIGLILMLPSLVVLAYFINKRGYKWFTLTGHN